MKLIYKTLAICAAVVSLSSCSKEFLEVYPKGSQIGSDRITEYAEKNPEVASGMLDAQFRGLYSWMYTRFAGGLKDNHGDFGQKSIDIMLDLLTGDMTKSLSTSPWYNDVITYTTSHSKGHNLNYMPWRFYYRLIFTANGMIDALGGDEIEIAQENTEIRHTMGQLLGMRGFAYFYLTQCYANEYEPSAKLLPLITTTAKVDLPKSTQEEIYGQIIKDLTRSVEYLSDFQQEEYYQMSSDVAKMYLAYTYAAMGDYANVKTLTSEIIKEGKYTPFTVSDILYQGDPNDAYYDENKAIHIGDPVAESGMGNVNLPGVMWGLDITTDMSLNIISYWGHMDMFTYSYATVDPMVLNSDLYKQFHDGDVRKGQFWRQVIGPLDLLPINKFYHKGRQVDGQTTIESDYIYMRYDEVVLLDIEADAFLGNEADARNNLKAYLSYAPDGKARMADVSYIDGLSGEALKDEICLQERLELWGEGRSIFTIRRFKKTVTFGSNRFDVTRVGQSMSYNDPEMKFLIPENEEINNINLNK